MLTRYKGQLKLKDWAFAIAKRSTMRKAQVALAPSPRDHYARDAASRNGLYLGVGLPTTETGDRIELPQGATPEGREQTTARILLARGITGRLRFQPCRPVPFYPHKNASERAENTGAPKHRRPKEPPALDVVDGPAQGTCNCRKVSRLERRRRGGRPCRNISELASTLPRIPFKSTLWRAKIVPPRNVN